MRRRHVALAHKMTRFSEGDSTTLAETQSISTRDDYLRHAQIHLAKAAAALAIAEDEARARRALEFAQEVRNARQEQGA